MNQLQQVELNILKEFDRVCSILGLPYYLVCGSALGAVKYRGFIPWDDDIDVGMLRDDYNAFVEKAPALLDERFFLQNYRSEPAFPQIYSKLRDSSTTYIEASAAHLRINHGVFIDVFPIDGYPKGRLEKLLLEGRKRAYQSMLLSAYNVPRAGRSAVLHRLYCMLGIDRRTAKVASRLEGLLSRYPVAESDLMCNHGNWQGVLEYAPSDQYGQGASVLFEGMNICVPEKFHDYLTQKYGDYTKDPPETEQVGHHYFVICDCAKSYECYIEESKR